MVEPFGGESFVQRIHSGASESPSKLRLVRPRLVLGEYLTFSLQGYFGNSANRSCRPGLRFISVCTPLVARKADLQNH
eukprot:scaffold74239_cov69-Phaeocystis_antarctica.AAC.1